MGEGLRERSGTLFPKANDRLTVLAGIARLPEPGQFSTKKLSASLGLPQPKVSKELARLRDVGLVERTSPGAALPLQRVASGFWAGCASLHEEWSSQEGFSEQAGGGDE